MIIINDNDNWVFSGLKPIGAACGPALGQSTSLEIVQGDILQMVREDMAAVDEADLHHI